MGTPDVAWKASPYLTSPLPSPCVLEVLACYLKVNEGRTVSLSRHNHLPPAAPRSGTSRPHSLPLPSGSLPPHPQACPRRLDWFSSTPTKGLYRILPQPGPRQQLPTTAYVRALQTKPRRPFAAENPESTLAISPPSPTQPVLQSKCHRIGRMRSTACGWEVCHSHFPADFSVPLRIFWRGLTVSRGHSREGPRRSDRRDSGPPVHPMQDRWQWVVRCRFPDQAVSLRRGCRDQASLAGQEVQGTRVSV